MLGDIGPPIRAASQTSPVGCRPGIHAGAAAAAADDADVSQRPPDLMNVWYSDSTAGDWIVPLHTRIR